MCRNVISSCVLCKEGSEQVVPCDERTKKASMITLFKADCINKHRYVFSYHVRCPNSDTDNTKLSDDDMKKYDSVMTDIISSTNRCSDITITKCDKSGNRIIHPDGI